MARVARLGVVIDSSGAKKGAQETNSALSSIDQTAKRAVESLKKAAATLGVAFAIKGIQQAVDQYTLLDARLKQVAGSGAAFARVQQELFTIAQTSRASYAATVDLYTRLARSSDQLGISQAQLVSVTEAVSNAVRLSNASTGAAEAGLVQLGQAFASGTLRGDELRSIMEQLPAVARAIADGLGVPIGKLREMGEAGELSGRKVALALDLQREKLALLAGEIPTTIGQALTQLNNAFGMVVAGSNEAKSATAGIAGVIGEVARFMVDYKDAVVAVSVALGVGGLTLAAGKAGAALLATSGGAALKGFVSLIPVVGSVTEALALLRYGAGLMWTAMTGPIGLTIAGLTAVAAAVYFWRTRQKETTDAVKETTKSAQELYDAAKKLASANWAPAEQLTQIQNLGFELRAAQTGGKQMVDVYREASKSWKDTSDKARTFGQALADGDARAKTLLATTTAQVQLSAQVESTLDRQAKAQRAAAKATEDRAAIEREYQGQWVQLGIELAYRAAEAERAHAEAMKESTKEFGVLVTKRMQDNAALQAQVAALTASRRAYEELTDRQEQWAAVAAAEAVAKEKGITLWPIMKAAIAGEVAESQRLLKVKQALLELDGENPFRIPVEETKAWGSALDTVASTARDIAQIFGSVGTEITKGIQLASQLVSGLSATSKATASFLVEASKDVNSKESRAAAGKMNAASLASGATIATAAFTAIGMWASATRAAAEEARQMAIALREARLAAKQSAEAFSASANGTPLQRELDGITATFNDVISKLLAAGAPRVDRLGARTAQNVVPTADLVNKVIDDYEKMIAAAKRASEFAAAQAEGELQARGLAAVGRTAEAEAMRQQLRNEKELEDARLAGATATDRARLAEIQAAEAAQRAAKQAQDRAAFGLDLTQRRQTLNGDSRGAFITGQTIASNSALTQAQELLEAGTITGEMFLELQKLLGDEMVAAIAAFDESLRQAKQAVQDDLAVRTLVAQGRGAEAEQARIEIANRNELAGVTDDAVKAQILYVQELEAAARASAAAAEAERVRLAQNASIDQRMIEAYRVLDPAKAKELEAKQRDVDRARELAEAADAATAARLRELYAMQDAAAAAQALTDALAAQQKQAEDLADFTRSISGQYLRATGKGFDADVADLNQWRNEQKKAAASVGAGAEVLAQIDAIYESRYAQLIADQMKADAPAPAPSLSSFSGSTAADSSITLGEDTTAIRSARSITEATALQLVDYAASQTALLRRIVQLMEGGSGPTGDALVPPSIGLVDRQLGARANIAAMLLSGSVR